MGVEAGLLEAVLEQRPMRQGRARGDNDAVQVVLCDALLNQRRAVLGAGVQQVLRMNDVRQPRGRGRNILDIHVSRDVRATMTDEDAEGGWLMADPPPGRGGRG